MNRDRNAALEPPASGDLRVWQLFASALADRTLALAPGQPEAAGQLAWSTVDEGPGTRGAAWRLALLRQVVAHQPGGRWSLDEATLTAARLWGVNRVGPVLLGIGLLGVLTLFGVLMVQFPDLPNPLPTRYTPDGLPEIVRDKKVLFRLPVIGLFAWLVNGSWGGWMMLRRQPVGAYLLWGGTIVVQVFLLFALYSVLP